VSTRLKEKEGKGRRRKGKGRLSERQKRWREENGSPKNFGVAPPMSNIITVCD